MQTLWQDVRYGLRMLGKNPGFAAVAILTLALGIGANTAIFSLLNAVVLQSMPVRNPQQLVVLRWSAHGRPQNAGSSSYGDCHRTQWNGSFSSGCSFSYPMFLQTRARTDVFSSVMAFAGPAQLNLSGNGPASMGRGELVSGNYFQTLGVAPALGRIIEASDELPGAKAVVVLSYGYWQSAFGSSPSAVGKTIRLNAVPFTIVGVADPHFTRLTPGKSQDMWLPLSQMVPLGLKWGNQTADAGNWWLTLVARLKPEVRLAQAESAISLLFRNEVTHGAKPALKDADKPEVVLLTVQQGLVGMREQIQEPLYLLMAAVGMVLLIACANVAGLLVARATARQREMAVRIALGAGRGRVIQQLLTESLLLSAAGAALGIVFAYWTASGLAAFLSANWPSPLQIDVQPDTRVLGFASGIAVLTGILFGLAPAFRSTRVDVAPTLKETAGSISNSTHVGNRRFGLANSLVMAQVALSMVVLVGAGLVVRTLANLKNINPGFDTHNVLLFAVDPTLTGYSGQKIQNLYSDLQSRLATLPGVVAASYSSGVLLDNGLWTSDVQIEGRSDKSIVEIDMLAVGPGFFETMRIPLLMGRMPGPGDYGSAQSVAVVNEAFVRNYLENKNPLGLHFGGSDPKSKQYQIVGIVGDAKYEQLRNDVAPTAYVPLQEGAAYFALRTASNPATLTAAVRRTVSDLDDNLPIFDVRTQTQTIDRLLFNERLIARLSSLFALLALILPCLGLYGLLSYEVARRTREIGIRTALGAQRPDILRLVVGQAAFLTTAGALLGIAIALGVTRCLRSLLYGVRTSDPLTFAAVALLLLTVALLACYLPARRATRVDPLVALRYE
jgi:predicted permease